MQLEGMLLLLIFIIIPVISIVSNDTAFFIILSLVLSFSSMKNILNPFLNNVNEDDQEAKELIEEVEDSINLDFNKIKLGLKTTKALIIILYFIYSCFFIDIYIYKIATAFIVVYWIRYIVETIKNKAEDENCSEIQVSVFDRVLSIFVNVISLIVILTTAYNKFFK